ncbi:N-carbamoyl-L-amino-acid hydrolase [Kineococcus xinjiangensis]|uniref:N-carbamoyl-L-amino-acid hydrolase n=1 Tax=Kineococcus xinjiangensis TaxID=512762 RepID=A0A2S6IEH0_9ACTN|nr:allantoate amidohydrolase [Kineococcus xinjiangensis]PPK92612.1 N-carbamoyl-L-amino-acid hydrolase [Kineococcus xinjiangensis]
MSPSRAGAATFRRQWSELEPVGRHAGTGGYRRFAWTAADATCREWFAAAAAERGLDVVADRAGNLTAWWGDPDGSGPGGGPGVVTGSHLDSVPDGGAFDGPLGIVTAFAALDALREEGFVPARPLGIAAFADEEGARFGVACAGSRLLTGELAPDRARALRDDAGTTLAEAAAASGVDVRHLGRDGEALRRIGCYVELHVEQGRALADLGGPVAVGSGIWPHGRYRLDLDGAADHAGTTLLADRRDPMLAYAVAVLAARSRAAALGARATFGRVRVEPGGTNAVPSRVQAWLDARAEDETTLAALVEGVRQDVAERSAREGTDVALVPESVSGAVGFDGALTARVRAAVAGAGAELLAADGTVPVLPTQAGHDAGILSPHVPTAMLFVRNPTGTSHSPAEHAEEADCLHGVRALTAVLADLLGEG